MVLLAIILIIIVLLYIYGTRTFKYWEVRGVKHPKPIPFLGTNVAAYLAQKSITQKCVEYYWKYPNEKVVGMYRLSKPALIIRDPDIIQKVLITDFPHFYFRGMVLDRTAVEPMMKNLFFADGDLWRLLRQRMTPAFTSGKLKAMFPLIVECAEKLQGHLINIAGKERPIDCRDLMARFTTDFIGACAFGLNADSLSDENSAFRQLGVKIFKVPTKLLIREIAKLMLPIFMRKNMKLMGHFEQDIIDLVQHILKQRNHEKSSRNDFIDLMMECKKKGLITAESIEHLDENNVPKKVSLEMTDELIAAQVFVFFAAGFETSSSATSFTLHQLAYNPEVQAKVQADVDKVLAKFNNKLSYDAVKDMTYLEWTFKEGLRMFPSLGFLRRECARKYTIPELNITIDEGVNLYVPLQALHNDPKYFDDPEVFNPDRFNPINMKNESKRVYFPFGAGPRACIGERLGQMQSLAGLAAVLSRFTVEPAPETHKYPIVEPRSHIVQSIKGGLPLYFKERKKLI